MQVRAILAALDTIMDMRTNPYSHEIYSLIRGKASFFVKYDNGEFIQLMMKVSEGLDFFEVLCNSGALRFDDGITTVKDNKGYKDIPGYSRHNINEWNSFIDHLLQTGWINRDGYMEDYSKYYVSKTPEEKYSEIQDQFSRISDLKTKITADAKHLISRLRFIGEVLQKVPEDYSPTVDSLKSEIDERNHQVLRLQYRETNVDNWGNRSAKAISDAQAILHKMEELDFDDDVSFVIDKIVDLLRQLYIILGPGIGEHLTKKARGARNKCQLMDVVNEAGINVRDAEIDRQVKIETWLETLPMENIPDLSELEDTDSINFSLAGNNITIENADEELKQEVLNCMGVSKGRYVNSYRIVNLNTQLAYDSAMTNIKGKAHKAERLLWHGSVTANWPSLIQNGMLMSKARKGMFGVGLYFADDLMKSRGYTSVKDSKWARGKDPTGFVALFRVRLGKSFGIDHGDFNAKRFLGKDYDSIKGKKGQNLRKNEYIVYNNNQCTIYALVEVS